MSSNEQDLAASANAVLEVLAVDREERQRAAHLTLVALVVAMVLFFIDAGALVGVVVITSKIRSVQREGVARAKATKANTEDLKRIAKDTRLTSAQLSCAFETATTRPGLSTSDPQENVRLINECVAERTRAP